MLKERIKKVDEFIKDHSDEILFINGCAIVAANISLRRKLNKLIQAYKWEVGYAVALIDVIKHLTKS